MAGAPRGNNNAGQGKAWKEALRRAIREAYAGQEFDAALAALATKLVKQTDGDNAIAALKEIGDRLDGKPAQAIEASGPDGGPVQTNLTVEFVRPIS